MDTKQNIKCFVKIMLIIPFFLAIIFMLGGCNLVKEWVNPNRAPVAIIRADPTSGEAPLEVIFDASDSYDPDGDEITFTWDFGDGNMANDKTVLHGFAFPGSYTIRLVVTDVKGKRGVSSVTISVFQSADERVKEYIFDLQQGCEYDSGMGLQISIPPSTTPGQAKLVVGKDPTPQHPAIDSIELYAIYNVSLEQAASAEGLLSNALALSSPATLTFEIPADINPNAAVILEWTSEGWVLAENTMGPAGGSLSIDRRHITLGRNRLSSFALGTIGLRILNALDKIPEPPPKPPQIEIVGKEEDYNGNLIVTIELYSPCYIKIPYAYAECIGGMYYCVVVESTDALKVYKGSDLLAPDSKLQVVIVFPPTGGKATISLLTRCPLALTRAVYNWASRLGLFSGKEGEILSMVELLWQNVEKYRIPPSDWKEIIWVIKKLFWGEFWKLVGSKAKFFANIVPVSIDMAVFMCAAWFDPDAPLDVIKTISVIPQNNPPIINSLIANPPTVQPGGQSVISVSAYDPDGDPLTYTWSASCGRLSSTTGPDAKIWTAPDTPGTCRVTVSVTDNKPNHSPVTRSVEIQVVAPTTVAAEIVDYWPASKIQVEIGESFTLEFVFENTGNTAWDFWGGYTIWDAKGNVVDDRWSSSAMRVAPGEYGSFSWETSLSTPGEYWLQFGIWKYRGSGLLDKAPSPSQNLIQVVATATVAAEIVDYWPASKIQVEIGESFTLEFVFENTGNTAWDFWGGYTIWDAKGNVVDDRWSSSAMRVAPGEYGSFSWETSLNDLGEYWLQFTVVWKYQDRWLFHQAPCPPEKLIEVVPPPGLIGLSNRVKLGSNISILNSLHSRS